MVVNCNDVMHAPMCLLESTNVLVGVDELLRDAIIKIVSEPATPPLRIAEVLSI